MPFWYLKEHYQTILWMSSGYLVQCALLISREIIHRPGSTDQNHFFLDKCFAILEIHMIKQSWHFLHHVGKFLILVVFFFQNTRHFSKLWCPMHGNKLLIILTRPENMMQLLRYMLSNTSFFLHVIVTLILGFIFQCLKVFHVDVLFVFFVNIMEHSNEWQIQERYKTDVIACHLSFISH